MTRTLKPSAVDVVGLNRQHFLERGRGAVSFERPDFHFSEALTTVLGLTTERLLRNHRVRAGRAGVDLVFDHVVKLDYVHHANRGAFVERFAGQAIVKLDTTVFFETVVSAILDMM